MGLLCSANFKELHATPALMRNSTGFTKFPFRLTCSTVATKVDEVHHTLHVGWRC